MKLNVDMGFPCLLTIIFVIAKLSNVINWSWLWVFSALWIPPVIGLVGVGIHFVINRYRGY